MELSINDFNIPDLLDFLEIYEENPNFSIVNAKINALKSTVSDNDNLIEFLENARTKIKSHYINLSSKIESEINSQNNLNISKYNNKSYKDLENNKIQNNKIEDDSEEDNNEEDNNKKNINEEDNDDDNEEEYDKYNNKNTIDSRANIANMHLLNLGNTSYSNEKLIDIYLNMNTNNRLITRPINNSINDIDLDSSTSFFIFPTTFNNIIETKLIDINIDYDSLSVVGDGRQNNYFEISSNIFNDLSINNPYKMELYPDTNDLQALITNIQQGLDGSDNYIKSLNNYTPGNNFPNFIKFSVKHNYAYFDFSGFYGNENTGAITGLNHLQPSQDTSDATFEIIFRKNQNNYNLANVLGFSQAIFNNTLFITKNTKAPPGVFDNDSSYIMQAASIIDYKLSHIYFAFNEFVQNANNDNHLLVANNQFSSNRVLAKLTLTTITDTSSSLTGYFDLKEANIIKDFNNTRGYDGPINIQKFRINIIDDYGNTIFLNYKNFSFTLKLKSSLHYVKTFKNIIND